MNYREHDSGKEATEKRRQHRGVTNPATYRSEYSKLYVPSSKHTERGETYERESQNQTARAHSPSNFGKQTSSFAFILFYQN